jgi:hypothetical protein
MAKEVKHFSTFFGNFEFLFFLIHTMFGSFLPPPLTHSVTTHHTPSLSPQPPRYLAETILPLSLILLKRDNRKEQGF